MATFEAQVEGLTSLSIDGSSAPTQTELTQFLTDGASEVINAMPRNLKLFCATEDTFTSTAVGSEAETLESSYLLTVTRSDGTIEQPCRKIPASLRGRMQLPLLTLYIIFIMVRLMHCLHLVLVNI